MTASRKRMPRDQRELAQKLIKQRERVQAMIWDRETPPRKLAAMERVVGKFHALYFRGRR
jgi:hypothetical protein